MEASQQKVGQLSANLPEKEKTSKFLYLGTSIIALIAGFIIAMFLSWVWYIFNLYIYIMFTIVLYKAWRNFPSVWTLAMPDRVIWYLYIPFISPFLAFHIIGGFPKIVNENMAKSNNIKYRMSERVFLSWCILNVAIYIVSIIYRFSHSTSEPFAVIILLIALTSVVLLLIMINQICNAIDAINTMTYSDEIQTQPDTVQYGPEV